MSNENLVRLRLIKYLEYKRFKNIDVSRTMKINQQNISNYINGTRKLSVDFIQQFVDKYNDISVEWLITGKGNMLKSEYKQNDKLSHVNEGSVYEKKYIDRLENEIEFLRSQLDNQYQKRKSS